MPSVVAALTFSFPAFAQSEPIVQENWGGTGMGWGNNAQLILRYIPANVNGKIRVCIAFVGTGGAQARDFHRAALKDAKVTLDGQTILRNLTFAKTVHSRHFSSAAVGQPAKCKATRVDYPSSGLPPIRVELRTGRYTVEKR